MFMIGAPGGRVRVEALVPMDDGILVGLWTDQDRTDRTGAHRGPRCREHSHTRRCGPRGLLLKFMLASRRDSGRLG